MDIITVCGELVVKSALMSHPRTVAGEDACADRRIRGHYD